MSRKKERKAEVERIRAEGAAAYAAGKHHQTNPYPRTSANRSQWWTGYNAQRVAEERNA